MLGGALVAISWQWVFWFNLPLALVAAGWGAVVLREPARPDSVRGLDVPGTVTFVIGLTGLVLGISRGGIDGWGDPIVIGGLAAVLLPLFLLIEGRGRAITNMHTALWMLSRVRRRAGVCLLRPSHRTMTDRKRAVAGDAA